MKLYYSRGACSLAVRILIHELGIDSDYESVDLKTKKTETGQDFYQINPKGAVPVIKLDNGNYLTENAVIHQYLADQNKADQLLPPLGDFERYHVLEWLNYVTTELHKGFGPMFNPNMPEEVKKEIIIPTLQKKFEFIDNQLKKTKYLAGDHYTLPDGYLLVMLLWAQHFKIDFSHLPHLKAYFEELKKRKSIERALKEEKLLLG